MSCKCYLLTGPYRYLFACNWLQADQRIEGVSLVAPQYRRFRGGMRVVDVKAWASKSIGCVSPRVVRAKSFKAEVVREDEHDVRLVCLPVSRQGES